MTNKLFFFALLAVINVSVTNAFNVRPLRSNSQSELRSQISGDMDSSLDMIEACGAIDATDADLISRRRMFQKGSSAALTACAALTTMTDSAFADIYDDQEKERKRKQKENAANGQKLVPLVLFGGTALSIPFFFPNLLRLGTKITSLGEDDGYGKKK